jgi:transposase
MPVHDHLSLDESRLLAKASAEKQVWVRYQVVILAAQGRSASEVASALGCGVRAVQGWVVRYNRGGPGSHAVLVLDGADYHAGEGLVVPAIVSLIHLVPYSPELNPVENLWHYLRAHHWSNRVYPDYDSLREAAVEAWRQVCLDPEKIRSVCAVPYLAERR